MVDESRPHIHAALALENDLFFAVKVSDTLKRAGYTTRIARSAAVFQELLGGAEFAVALVNASARGVDWQACIVSARAMGLPVIAYAAHVDLDTQAAARAAGATRVIANSRLAELQTIVARVVARAAAETDGADDASDSE